VLLGGRIWLGEVKFFSFFHVLHLAYPSPAYSHLFAGMKDKIVMEGQPINLLKFCKVHVL
jgi:hypothetical protein